MEPIAKPLDALNIVRNRKVIVDLKNGRTYVGKLKAFDVHVNIVLEGAEEKVNGETTRTLSMMFLRGDTIVLITPVE